MTNTSTLLSVDQLCVSTVGNKLNQQVVKKLSFTLFRNEVLCIVGESGSGKSVTAAAIMGLLSKDQLSVSSGSILYQNKDMVHYSDTEWRNIRGKNISMVFQEPMTALNPIMTVGKQVDEVLERHTSLNASDRKQRILDIFAEVLLPEPIKLYDAFPFQISGGQRQRVMIAMALVLEPEILIADEPTTALDVTTQAQILHLIKDIQKRRQIGVIFITHDFGVVAEIANRIVVMNQGEVVETGTADQILNRPSHPYTCRLITAVPHHPKGKAQAHNGPPLLIVKNLSKVFGDEGGRRVQALQDLSFTLEQGEIIGVVGESGSGKSTLGRVLVGLQKPDSGEVLLDGVNLLTLSFRQLHAYRRQIQMVFQDPFASLNPRHKVIQAIVQGPLAFGVSKTQAHQEALELLELVGLSKDSADRYPHQFSGGQRQRIGIARALALKPRILIADEAVSALDVSIQAQVLLLLKDISKKFGLSILFITHDLRVAAQLCDRIAVMRKGELVELSRAMDVYSRPEHEYTKKLIDSIPGKHWEKPELTPEAI